MAMMASSNNRCSIVHRPGDILVRSITNSPQYTQMQCGRNLRSALHNVFLVHYLILTFIVLCDKLDSFIKVQVEQKRKIETNY